MSTTQPIKSYDDVQRFKNYFLERCEYRNYLLVSVCLNTALRIQDVLSLRWEDLISPKTKRAKKYIYLTETKTGKHTAIKINKAIKTALALYIKHEGINGQYLFANKNGTSLSRTYAFEMVRNGGKAIGLEHKISPHSLRKTFGYHAVKNGTPPAVIMQIYNHSSYEVTKRYLGINQEEKDKVYMAVNL